MATKEEQEKEEQRRRAALAIGAAAAAAAAPPPRLPTPEVRMLVAGAIVATLVDFLTTQRARQRAWLREQMTRQVGIGLDVANSVVAGGDIDRLIVEEERREETFARKQTQRFMRDVSAALLIPEPDARERRVQAITSREESYVRSRSMAMAARAFSALDRVVLRQQSPMGAYWHLDPTVKEHTAGCLVMGRKFWPWAVLDRVHPPRHGGCPCRLLSFGDAVARGLMAAGDVQDVRDAVRAAALVVMEGVVEEGDDVELLRDLLFEAHLIELEDAAVVAGMLQEDAVREVHEAVHLGQPKTGEVAEALGDAGLGLDAAGWFAYSHASRSASYATAREIPAEVALKVLA